MMSFNFPKRQSTGKPPHIEPDPCPAGAPAGLIKALMDTGRTKGSSATPGPPVVSPNPNRAIQAQIEKMDDASQARDNEGKGIISVNSHTRSSSQYPGVHNRSMSSATQQSFQSGGYGSRAPSPGTGPSQFRFGAIQGSDEPMTVARFGQVIHDGLGSITAKLEGCTGIDPNVQYHLINEARRLAQEAFDAQQQAQLEADKVASDRNALYQQIEIAHEQLRTTTSDKDHYCMERDQLRRTVEALREKEKKNAEKYERLEQHYMQQIEDLQKQISVQDEQLKGKRALWLESNPGSSARREAMNAAMRDPFNSPSTSQRTGYDSGYIGGIGSVASSSIRSPPRSSFVPPPASLAPVGAPRGPRRKGNLPVGSALPGKVLPNATWTESSSFRVFKTEPNTPPPTSMALVPFKTDDDPAPRFKAEFSKIFALVEGWVKTYANIPNPEKDQKIARSNDALWAYMMNCTYPGQRQDAHTHVMTLLDESNSRFWFVMRMAITYLTKEVMTIGVFYGFNPGTDNEFEEVKKKLLERGLANEARQKLIDQQARAVQSIIASPTYQDFRSTHISVHTKKLRDILGPLLNPGGSRAEAGRDLGAITIKAWELSVKMFTSHLTFQIYFPETATKFHAATMIAKDQPRADPMHLQIRQTRLKLVITPVITLRDDRGTTIKAKNLHMSTVLTMG